MQKLKKFIRPVLIASPLVLLLVQCSVGSLAPIMVGKKIWASGDSNTLKNEVRRKVLVGSSITDAEQILAFNGFKCEYKKDSDTPNVWNIREKSKDGDYLLYDRSQSYIVCSETYITAIYYIKDKITDLDALAVSQCFNFNP